jgi:hypothetical protein
MSPLGLGAGPIQLSVLVLPSHQKSPENGDGFSPWNAGKPLHLDAAVAREHFIDFCRRDIFKTYITFWHLVVFQSCYTSLTIPLYLLSFSSTGSTLNTYKISSLLLWSKVGHPDVLQNLILIDVNHVLSFCLTVHISLAWNSGERRCVIYVYSSRFLEKIWCKCAVYWGKFC